MAARRRINRWTLILLNLILSIQSGAHANDDIVKSLLRERDLQDTVVFACAGVDEISQEGNIYMEVKGRPAYLQEGHLHVLENALVSLYEAVAKQTCSSGYRHLTGARVNRNSIPDTTDVVTFVMDFETTGRCKGCADNIDFLTHFRRHQRRIRATPQKSHRWLSSQKGSKKITKKSSRSSSVYYYQYYGDPRSSSSSSSSSRYYYGNTPVDLTDPTSSCHCPPPVVEGLEDAFRRITQDILDLRSIYDGTSRLGGVGGAPIFPTPTPPPTIAMPNPSPTPPPTAMMPEPTSPPTKGQVNPTEPPGVSPPPTASPTRRTSSPSSKL